MRYRRRIKKRVLVGCEGKSEQGLAAWLQDGCNDLGLDVYLDTFVIGKGDPLEVLQATHRRYRPAGIERHTAGFALLDDDRVRDLPGSRRHMLDRVVEGGPIKPIWQRPRLEAVLVRLLNQNRNLRPDAMNADRQLRRIWPEYRKPLTRLALHKRIGVGSLEMMRASDEEFEPLVTILLRLARRSPT